MLAWTWGDKLWRILMTSWWPVCCSSRVSVRLTHPDQPFSLPVILPVQVLAVRNAEMVRVGAVGVPLTNRRYCCTCYTERKAFFGVRLRCLKACVLISCSIHQVFTYYEVAADFTRGIYWRFREMRCCVIWLIVLMFRRNVLLVSLLPWRWSQQGPGWPSCYSDTV